MGDVDDGVGPGRLLHGWPRCPPATFLMDVMCPKTGNIPKEEK